MSIVVSLLLGISLAAVLPARAVSWSADLDIQIPVNDRPVIGILTQELSDTIEKFYGYHHSYISAAYVELIEGSGARVSPIFIGRDDSYYRKMVHSLNGILFPGGATYFTNPNGYGKAGMILYDEVLRANRLGEYVPLLGICLGMELIAVLAGGGIANDLRTTCKADGIDLPLNFLPGSESSRLYRFMPASQLSVLSQKDITVNEHGYCVTPKNFTLFGLLNDYDILTTDFDENGLEFVSSFESKEMPIYALQFHPEKYSYEWKVNKKYPHSPEAIQIGRYFADFFVQETRRNNHSFCKEDEDDFLIYNYNTTYTGRHLMYEQLYFFSDADVEDAT